MKPLKLAIDLFGKAVFPELWTEMKASVGVAEEMQKQGMLKSGADKKRFALERMEQLGYLVATGLIETCLQVAWLWLQAYLGRSLEIKKK